MRPIRRFFTCLCIFQGLVFAATQATFDHQQYPAKGESWLVGQTDLNKDGIPDLITWTVGESGFDVQLSTGPGVFGPPQRYDSAWKQDSLGDVAVEDFNRDGNADVIYVTGNNLVLFLGNGDGTLRPETPISGTTSAHAVATADFNRDGKLDLIFGAGRAGSEPLRLKVALGNGDGTFRAPSSVYQIPISDVGIDDLATGDFDGDSKADAFFAQRRCSNPGCVTNFYVAYGNGAGGFSTHTFQRNIGQQSTVADVNRDGKSDLIGAYVRGPQSDEIQGMRIFSGKADRTFSERTFGENSAAKPSNQVAAADLNGDGRTDIAASADQGSTRGVGIFYRNADGSYSSPVFYPLFENTSDHGTLLTLLTADYDRNRKPDLVVMETNGFNNARQHELLNITQSSAFPSCSTVAKPFGINACAPVASSTVTSPATFRVSGLSLSPIRKIEIWVDGQKRKETFGSYSVYSFADSSVTLTPGSHTATIFAVGYDNRKQKRSVTFNSK
jgi:hypothetical protein